MDTITATYLNRLGVEAERLSAEALARLHRAHVERVPYETFWIHLAQGGGSTRSSPRGWPPRGAAVTATSSTGLWTLLTALGYRVSLHVAGVHEAAGPDVSTLCNHAALVVEGLPTDTNPGGRWWSPTPASVTRCTTRCRCRTALSPRADALRNGCGRRRRRW